MSIGEPRHPVPEFVGRIIAEHTDEFSRYPPNEGTPELRAAIADWLVLRYGVTIDPETGITALNGTREGLFNAGLALSPERKRRAGRSCWFPIPSIRPTAPPPSRRAPSSSRCRRPPRPAFLPDYAALPAALLDRVTLCYVCSPSNPQGAVAGGDYLRDLLALAERHDFRVLADECYSEIYRDAPPPGALAAARRRELIPSG